MLQFFRRCFCFFSTKNDTIPLLKDTVPWTPPIKEGFVIKVYDADTITIASKLPYNNSPIYRWSVRIKGIDAPELKSKNSKLAELALQGKEELSENILGKKVFIKNIATEKYGRILADVFLNDINIGDWLIDQKYAYQYDGKTKLTESEQCDLLIYNI
tara:strand:- start:47 stop:520 length:474 start_codon:yes stop_codon:yes gene_type:complete